MAYRELLETESLSEVNAVRKESLISKTSKNLIRCWDGRFIEDDYHFPIFCDWKDDVTALNEINNEEVMIFLLFCNFTVALKHKCCTLKAKKGYKLINS